MPEHPLLILPNPGEPPHVIRSVVSDARHRRLLSPAETVNGLTVASSDFVDGASLEVRVNCRADAGVLEEEVPYALVSTIEVTSDLWVADIYDEVRAGGAASRGRMRAAGRRW